MLFSPPKIFPGSAAGSSNVHKNSNGLDAQMRLLHVMPSRHGRVIKKKVDMAGCMQAAGVAGHGEGVIPATGMWV